MSTRIAPRQPTRATHPLLYLVMDEHFDYYKATGTEGPPEYVTRRNIEIDFHKDSRFKDLCAEAGLDPAHLNAKRTFRRLVWPIISEYVSARHGWWAKSTGRGASFFHESWGTPEDCRDAINVRLQEREKDNSALTRLLAITETKCGQLGWSFDPQYDDAGALQRVEVWSA